MVRNRLARRDIFIALIGLLAGLAILLFWLSPRVVDADQQEIPISASEPIRITLNRPVTLESAMEHFSITPAVPGEIELSGRHIIFQPDEPLDYGGTVTVSLSPGIRGINGLPGLLGTTLNYTIKDPRLLFLQETDGRSNVWRREPSGEFQQLTDEATGVWDYQSIPDSRGILYSSLYPDDSADLVLLTNNDERRVLLECPGERCISGQWQPGGSLIAFERIPLAVDPSNPAEVWILDTGTGDLKAAIDPTFLSDGDLPSQTSYGPRWSRDGRYLALYQPEARVVVIVDTNDGSIRLVPANLEIMGGWSLVADQLAYSELAFGDPDFQEQSGTETAIISSTQPFLYDHITVVDMAKESATDLSVGQEADYGQPSWHPDGEFLAVSRAELGGAWQIWLLPVGGEDPRSLTDDPLMNHTSLSWSPDGQQLAFMGNDRMSGTGPDVWLLDSKTGQAVKVVDGAYLPAWQP